MVQYLEKFFRCVCKGKGILYPSKVFLPTKYIFPTREADQILQKSLGEEIASNCSFGSFCRHLSHPIINQPLCSDDDHFISVIQLTTLCTARRWKCNLHSDSLTVEIAKCRLLCNFFHLFLPEIYETGELSWSHISDFQVLTGHADCQKVVQSLLMRKTKQMALCSPANDKATLLLCTAKLLHSN